MSVATEMIIKGELFMESGGGDLFAVKGDAKSLYKKPHSVDDVLTMCELWETWQGMAAPWIVGSSWAKPTAMVKADGNIPCGYVMPKVEGITLHKWVQDTRGSFPFVEVLAKVAAAMSAAIDAGVYPMIEHGGNVMLSGSPGAMSVTIIDVDACRRIGDVLFSSSSSAQ